MSSMCNKCNKCNKCSDGGIRPSIRGEIGFDLDMDMVGSPIERAGLAHRGTLVCNLKGDFLSEATLTGRVSVGGSIGTSCWSCRSCCVV